MNLIQKDIERFWSGVNRLGLADCWEWQRYCNKDGYGQFWLNVTMEKAHRVSWFLVNGLIPELFEGLPTHICHTCDNPPCCNPAHLFLGNQRINQKDSSVKGRKPGSAGKCRGENNPKALKTEIEIREIKQDLREGVLTQEEIGLKHGLVHQTISLIKLGKTWSHIK